jgi:hypothetical protein
VQDRKKWCCSPIEALRQHALTLLLSLCYFCCLQLATCADSQPGSEPNTAFPCEFGTVPNPNAQAASPPSQATCCLVSCVISKSSQWMVACFLPRLMCAPCCSISGGCEFNRMHYFYFTHSLVCQLQRTDKLCTRLHAAVPACLYMCSSTTPRLLFSAFLHCFSCTLFLLTTAEEDVWLSRPHQCTRPGL